MRSNSELPRIVSGAAAGLFGAWVMSRFADAWNRINGDSRSDRGQLFCGSPQERETTLNIASRLGRAVLRRKLNRREQEIGAAAVHYLTGAVLGGGYALVGGRLRAVTRGRGAMFGAAFWAAGDELLLPTVGVLRKPQAYAPAAHLNALAEHVVFGVATDFARRAVQKFL